MSKKTENLLSCPYNSRLQKGGALLEDMRLLVRHWQDGCDKNQMDTAVLENLLGKRTRSRAIDIFRVSFLPRFLKGSPPDAWKIVRELEERNVSLEILRPIYYWVTARNERILYEFVSSELLARKQRQEQTITKEDVIAWLNSRLASCGKMWSDSVISRVAAGVLAALRDFGILEGVRFKKIAPVYLPVESFAYIAFALYQGGTTGPKLVKHPDWSLFLIILPIIERMFLEADRHGFLRYHAAGRIVRIDFPAKSFKEMAGVIATKPH